MAVEVETPEDYMGNVMGDTCPGGAVSFQGMEDIPGGIKAIKAEVPAEMFGYATNCVR